MMQGDPTERRFEKAAPPPEPAGEGRETLRRRVAVSALCYLGLLLAGICCYLAFGDYQGMYPPDWFIAFGPLSLLGPLVVSIPLHLFFLALFVGAAASRRLRWRFLFGGLFLISWVIVGAGITAILCI